MGAEGQVLIKILGDAKGLGRTLDTAGGKLKSFGKSALKVGLLAGGAIATGAGILAAKGIEAAREANAINRITENVIKTTRGAANVTAKHVDDLSAAIQKTTGISDEFVQRGSNMLLTFTNIRNEVGKGNDIFDQATRLAVDLSTAMGVDVKDSAIQMGKALNDPVKGVSALSRVGIQFTEDQKKVIESLVESGDTLGAQKIILAELEKQFGGTAEAASDPMKRLKAVMDDVVETVGQALLPVLDPLADWLAEVLPGAVDRAMTWIREHLVPAFRSIKAWWDDNGPAVIAAVQAVWEGIKGVFDLVVAGVQTVIDWFRTNRDEVAGATQGLVEKIKPLWDQFVETITAGWEALQATTETVVAIVTELWEEHGEAIVSAAEEHFGNLLRILESILEQLQGIFEVIGGVMEGDWSKVFKGMGRIAEAQMAFAKSVVLGIFHVLKSALLFQLTALRGAWSYGWSLIKQIPGAAMEAGRLALIAITRRLVGWMKSVPLQVKHALGNLRWLLYNVGKDVLRGLWSGMLSMWTSVKSWLSNLGGQIRRLKGPIQKDRKLLTAEGAAVMEGFGVGLESGWQDVKRQLAGMTAQVPAIAAAGGGTLEVPAGTLRESQSSRAPVTINVYGAVGDRRELAKWLRDELRRVEREDR